MLTDELMAHALSDQSVRKRSPLMYRVGVRVDAEDLRHALERYADASVTREELDKYVRARGGQRLNRSILRFGSRLLGHKSGLAARAQYWFPAMTYQAIRRKNG